MDTQTNPRAAVLRSRDFIGRDVLDAASDKVGTIRDLLLDRRSGTVRFIEIDLGVFKKQVVVPVERVDWGEEAFIMRGWKAEQIQKLPGYDTDRPLTEETLDELVYAFPRFYEGEDFGPPPSSTDRPVLPLKEAKDFRVKKDDTDLRGWNVFGSDGERLGKVTEMLVDPAAMKVAYLDVDLFDDLFTLKDDRHVLLPVEAVDVRERGRDVWLRDLTAREAAHLPAYTGGPADPIVLSRVDHAFRRTAEVREPRESGSGVTTDEVVDRAERPKEIDEAERSGGIDRTERPSGIVEPEERVVIRASERREIPGDETR